MRTFGLCFGIQTKAKSEVFGSVLIKKRPLLQIGQLSMFHVYDIYYTENFNPNSRTQLLFEKGLYKIHVAAQLEKLCRRFNNQRSRENFKVSLQETDETKLAIKIVEFIYQCPDCLTVYDPEYGDATQNIAPGTAFEDLPETYCCALCDAGKATMIATELNKSTLSELPA